MSDSTDLQPIFNWRPSFDERSKDYPIRAAVVPGVRRNKLWRTGPVLNQGREGACVGFGWTAEALSTPVAVDLNRVAADVPRTPQEFAHALYVRAKQLDTWPGEDYSGTAVIAGAKAMKEYGLLNEYRWAFHANDVIDAVIQRGPVVLGINWYDGMYQAPNGVLGVSGPVVGGHCITVVGYVLADSSKTGAEAVILQNSWGPRWGQNGLAELKVSDLERLLADDGEACVPYRRSYGRAKK